MPCKISTHTSRVGCDGNTWRLRRSHRISTHTSRVGCDAIALFNAVDASFLLTHPVWDVTHIEEKIQLDVLISTHTSRVGCDYVHHSRRSRVYHFYSHIPCGMWLRLQIFWAHDGHFYSHIPCGMWQRAALYVRVSTQISTHTSRVGCDEFLQDCILMDKISTHTSRVGCDLFSLKLPRQHQISTHTSRVGCDSYHLKQIRWLQHFYSHIPCGMWLP